MVLSLATKVTLARILVIPLIVALLLVPYGWAAWSALVLFILAALTDWLDGYLARREEQVSRLGTILDPIADKLLVAAVVLILVYNGGIAGWGILPALIILMREVAVSGLREFLAELRISVPVSRLAKWKTGIQMVALSFLIVGDHAPFWTFAPLFGTLGLWLAGLLTVVTGYDYWRASLEHLTSREA